jgi:hypothetical protein
MEELHSAVSLIDLPACAPPSVSKQFQVARNLLLYSWFVYEFATVAELYAYSTVELALRERIGPISGTWPFRRLLKFALDEGWLQDVGFRRGRERVNEWLEGADERASLAELGMRFEPLDMDPQYYARILCNVIPDLRNYLAHGNPARFRGAISTLEYSSEIIGQLFSSHVGLNVVVESRGAPNIT